MNPRPATVGWSRFAPGAVGVGGGAISAAEATQSYLGVDTALRIHRTLVVTYETINRIAPEGDEKVKLFPTCENQQRVGAIKAREAFDALG
jgi:hypothetical protein